MFLTWINNIYLSSPLVSFHLFADYTCIFHSTKNYLKLEQGLNSAPKNVATWLKANKLTLNADKSTLLLFNLKRYQKSANINIHLADDKLKPKDYTKYLGVSIDSKLAWEKQIQMTNSKLQRGIGIIMIMRNFPQEKAFQTIIFDVNETLHRLWKTCLGRCSPDPFN